jgi:hypothetical protein
MIANHTQFTAAIEDRKKVCVRFYSKPDSGVLDRVCAPMEYGPGENPDGLNRYWLWDYANETGAHTIGLIPQQILDLRVLGDGFDPLEFIPPPGAAPADLPSPPAPLTKTDKIPIL